MPVNDQPLRAPLINREGEVNVLFGTRETGPGAGISRARFDTQTGHLGTPELIMEAERPAYFIVSNNRKFLYSCNSGDTFGGNPNGGISAYAIDPKNGRLNFLNSVSSDGMDPSYISLDAAGTHVLTANYKTGNFVVHVLAADGSLGDRTSIVQLSGSSVHPIRQMHSFAHCIVIDPSGQFALVVDLGSDQVFVYRYNDLNGKVEPHDPPAAHFIPGEGPRHLSFHPNGHWAYLVTEMGNTVHFMEWNAVSGRLSRIDHTTTLPVGFHGTSTTAEIRVHPNGRFLYVTNRGVDTLAVFSIDQANGSL